MSAQECAWRTVVEVASDAVVRKRLGADCDVSEPQPGERDGACRDEEQPKRLGTEDGVSEGLIGESLIVDGQYHL